jgi:hypothetical protein
VANAAYHRRQAETLTHRAASTSDRSTATALWELARDHRQLAESGHDRQHDPSKAWVGAIALRLSRPPRHSAGE